MCRGLLYKNINRTMTQSIADRTTTILYYLCYCSLSCKYLRKVFRKQQIISTFLKNDIKLTKCKFFMNGLTLLFAQSKHICKIKSTF